jgi:hypothetical protein
MQSLSMNECYVSFNSCDIRIVDLTGFKIVMNFFIENFISNVTLH